MTDLGSAAPVTPWRGVRLVVFDLDGTLVDAFGDIAAAANFLLASRGRPPLTVEQVKRFVGEGVRVLVSRVLDTNDAAEIDEACGLLVEYYKRWPCEKAVLYPGVLEMLQHLRAAGVKTAVASNKPHPLTDLTLNKLGVSRLLDFIHGESPRFPRKPEPDLLRHIMAEAGAEPVETVMVGDSFVDVQFAHAAGVRCLGVAYGQHTLQEMQSFGADAVAETPAAIVERLGLNS
ncbi:MAG: HAD-IA family hydrolase [Candidatus Sumerlaeaceae bacterium]|nr:HAD-IA family hydrolase [Candidatus Sumerlaeaceae bacterium]